VVPYCRRSVMIFLREQGLAVRTLPDSDSWLHIPVLEGFSTERR
jgi:hypothetical protein